MSEQIADQQVKDTLNLLQIEDIKQRKIPLAWAQSLLDAGLDSNRTHKLLTAMTSSGGGTGREVESLRTLLDYLKQNDADPELINNLIDDGIAPLALRAAITSKTLKETLKSRQSSKDEEERANLTPEQIELASDITLSNLQMSVLAQKSTPLNTVRDLASFGLNGDEIYHLLSQINGPYTTGQTGWRTLKNIQKGLSEPENLNIIKVLIAERVNLDALIKAMVSQTPKERYEELLVQLKAENKNRSNPTINVTSNPGELTDLQIAALTQSNIPLSEAQILLDLGLDANATYKILSQMGSGNAARKTYWQLKSYLTRAGTDIQSVQGLIEANIDGDTLIALLGSKYATPKEVLELHQKGVAVNYAHTLLAHNGKSPKHPDHQPLSESTLIKLSEMKSSYYPNAITGLAKKAYPDKSQEEAVLSLMKAIPDPNDWHNGINKLATLLSLGLSEKDLKALQSLYPTNELVSLYEGHDISEVTQVALLGLGGPATKAILDKKTTPDEIIEARKLGIGVSLLEECHSKGIEIPELRKYVQKNIKPEYAMLIVEGLINEDEAEYFQDSNANIAATSAALHLGVSPNGAMDLVAILDDSQQRRSLDSGALGALREGVSEDILLRLQHVYGPSVEESLNYMKDKSSGHIGNRLYQYNSLGVPISKAWKATAGKVDDNSRLMLLAAVAEENIVGDIENTLPIRLVLKNLEEATTPREIRAALKPLNKALEETAKTRLNTFIKLKGLGWTGDKLVENGAAGQRIRTAQTTAPQKDHLEGSLGETYGRIGKIVDWYAIVLTDKLWTPTTHPAIIDKRSDLFKEIEETLIQLQDHKLMKGTLSIDLEDLDADLNAPAPRDLRELAFKLETQMSAAWKKAEELGNNYEKDLTRGPDNRDEEQRDTLEVQAAELMLEAKKNRRLANLALRNSEDTIDGANARARGEKLLKDAETAEQEASELGRQAQRLDMGTDTIANRVRILANHPRLQNGKPTPAIGD